MCFDVYYYKFNIIGFLMCGMCGWMFTCLISMNIVLTDMGQKHRISPSVQIKIVRAQFLFCSCNVKVQMALLQNIFKYKCKQTWGRYTGLVLQYKENYLENTNASPCTIL